jgi:hypothetical protein
MRKRTLTSLPEVQLMTQNLSLPPKTAVLKLTNEVFRDSDFIKTSMRLRPRTLIFQKGYTEAELRISLIDVHFLGETPSLRRTKGVHRNDHTILGSFNIKDIGCRGSFL